MTEQAIGRFRWSREATPYEVFMSEQGVPVVRGMGVYDVRDVTLAPWKRMGGQGAFIELDGASGLRGIYVLEIPASGATPPERHIYEEVFYVVEGRGSTEIWVDDEADKQVFEWRTGALFTAPLNTFHRIVNAASEPALLLAVTNAPPLMTLFRNEAFIFDTPFHFKDRFDKAPDFFRSVEEIATRPDNGRYHYMGNIIPTRSTRRSRWTASADRDTATTRGTWRGTAATGTSPSTRAAGTRSATRTPQAGAPLPQGAGIHHHMAAVGGYASMEEGNGHLVKRQDYVPGGLVSAAPGDANWFHGHYGVAQDPLRVLAFLGTGLPRGAHQSAPGEETVSQNEDVSRGGGSIDYSDEDPYIRKMYEDELGKHGVRFDMAEELYR